jgi:hypothetical protein
LVNIQGNIKLVAQISPMQPTINDPIDTMEELEAFRLKTLEKKKKIRTTTIVLTIADLLILTLFCLLSGGVQGGAVMAYLFVTGIIILILQVARTQKTMKEYRRIFRSIVVNKMWQNVDPEVSFEPGRYIPRDWFLGSRIYRVNPNTYKGENHITKRFNNFTLYASELDVTRRGGGKNNSNVPVFNGLFFVFELHNRQFSGTTLIMRDANQSPLGFLTGLVESITYYKYNSMQFNNPEFEKYFQIFSTNQDETKDVVQNDVVIQLLATRMEKMVQMSFVGRYVCIAIDDRGTFFQADPKISLTDENSLRKYLNELDKYQSYYSRFIPIIERVAG